MKIIIAGSRGLPKGQAPRLLIRLLAMARDTDTILLRRGINKAGSFEMDVSSLCSILHLDWEWCLPEPTDQHPGRASVYVRDMDMVERADFAVLFFTPEDAADGYSGTYHLLDKCLDVGRPVHAYQVDTHGVVERVGDYDPDHQFENFALQA